MEPDTNQTQNTGLPAGLTEEPLGQTAASASPVSSVTPTVPPSALPTGFTEEPIAQGAAKPPEQSGTQQSGIQQAAAGFASEGATGLAGIAKLGSHIPGVPWLAEKIGNVAGLPKLPTNVNPYDTVQNTMATQHQAATQSTAGMEGSGAESLAEFVLYDAAFKGLSIAERAGILGKLAKVAESHPMIAKVIESGMRNARLATVAGGMTAEHGGTVTESMGSAAGMAAFGVATEGLWGTGKLGYNILKRAGYGGAALDAVTKLAGEHTKPAEEIVDTLQHKLNNHEAVMHTSFDNAMENIKGMVGTENVPIVDSPLHVAANTIKGEAERLPVEVTKSLKGLVPTEGTTKDLVDALTDGTVTTMTGENLINLRQRLSQRLPFAAPAVKQEIGTLLDGIDDTLDQVVGGKGDEVSSVYSAARLTYKQSIADLKDSFIQRIRSGKVSDVLDAMGRGQIAPHNIETLKRLVGDDTVAALGLNKFADLIHAATDDEGNLIVKKAITGWDKLSPTVKNSMFEATPVIGQRLGQLMEGLRSVSRTRSAIKFGVGALGVGTAALGASGFVSGAHTTMSAIETVVGLAAVLGVSRLGGG